MRATSIIVEIEPTHKKVKINTVDESAPGYNAISVAFKTVFIDIIVNYPRSRPARRKK